MKTQIVPGSYDSMFFPVTPVRAGKFARANGRGPGSPRLSLEPIVARRIYARTAARHDDSGLPASLADWLVCKEALDIRQRDCEGTENGSDVWVVTARPVAPGKSPAATLSRPSTAL